ncbi:hypothetical protein H0H81_010564 [Sphagnurus paluster]|uniref:Uncharacterized protein n=1 Tax=Sphagnurus paluster TaxID=117069 RepID=A0A9P7GPU5_9AGAR|nr:hypothetical protein H0H81_010564 [Sphagnurus paluster]
MIMPASSRLRLICLTILFFIGATYASAADPQIAKSHGVVSHAHPATKHHPNAMHGNAHSGGKTHKRLKHPTHEPKHRMQKKHKKHSKHSKREVRNVDYSSSAGTGATSPPPAVYDPANSENKTTTTDADSNTTASTSPKHPQKRRLDYRHVEGAGTGLVARGVDFDCV